MICTLLESNKHVKGHQPGGNMRSGMNTIFVCYLFMFEHCAHTFRSVMSFETLHVIFCSAIYEHFFPLELFS